MVARCTDGTGFGEGATFNPMSRGRPVPEGAMTLGALLHRYLLVLPVLCVAPLLSAQGRDTTYTLPSGGLTRSYLLHLPPSTGDRPLPLVILLHGRLGTGAGMVRLTHFNTVADSAGVIVAYPDGWRRSWADGRMGTPADRQGVDDVAFILTMIDDIAGRAAVDTTRIYVAGISNGGFMTERLACEAGRRFAAVGVVSATFGDSLAARCRLHPPVPVEFFNGTADPLVPYSGGQLGGGRGHVLGVDATVALWAEDEACPATPEVQALPDTAHDGTVIVRRSYSPCGGRGTVVAFKVEGGGHTWPGGTQYLPKRFVGIASKNLDASRELWRFFAARRR